ncbi:hypothetical protein CYLTODRAFT_446826 [Cylindrobasidium torrendii FP15055 ss-10]|uniref:Uncharacterized protein n=1 Tax=Cylindrobasidium torrendii FP15055 ss-10 TaxID=1314674 RepID=A0A0D7AXI9_9AGAR|nr:hypothetical protein CYLTODRAFT_446826 [Cylindrobasidium torrendii FP15055 ss-10]
MSTPTFPIRVADYLQNQIVFCTLCPLDLDNTLTATTWGENAICAPGFSTNGDTRLMLEAVWLETKPNRQRQAPFKVVCPVCCVTVFIDLTDYQNQSALAEVPLSGEHASLLEHGDAPHNPAAYDHYHGFSHYAGAATPDDTASPPIDDLAATEDFAPSSFDHPNEPARPVDGNDISQGATAGSNNAAQSDEPGVGDASQDRQHSNVNDLIKTEWHPGSGKPVEIVPFSEYRASVIEKAPPVPIADALGPFKTELDAEFCEWMLDANISSKQGDKLIEIVTRFANSGRSPQVKTWADWKKTMDAATALTTPFKKQTFTVPFAGENLEYTVVFRDLVKDVLLVLDDPNLQPLLEIWARRTYKSHDGGKTWERFITQPWTADIWWELDTLFPNRNDLPIRILIYSDKTRLSSFGSVQGWPIYWRLLHLDSDIRNSRGIGGGRVAGFLPQFREDKKYKTMVGWADHKREVYMQAYSIVLESVRKQAISGVSRRLKSISELPLILFIIIMIISADLDEQSMFALTRGFKSKAPCPVCFVDDDSLLEDGPFSLRTMDHAQALHDWANTPGLTKKDIEKEYKKRGMRKIEVLLQTRRLFCADHNSQNILLVHLPHLDIFRTLSVCTMHTNAGGNWPHIRDETIDYLTQLAKDLRQPELVSDTDAQMATFPRWSGLNHFEHWLSKNLSDATKNEDMSIQVMYCLHTALTPDRKHGYLLLRALRAYHELNAYGNLTVHTSTTIQQGLDAHSRYLKRLKDLQAQYPHDKAWGFPKSHTPLHLFADIVAKGCQVTFSTKPSEQMHSSIKDTYQNRTNFKNLATYESYFDAMLTVRHNIAMNKAATAPVPKDEYDEDPDILDSGPSSRKRRRTDDNSAAKAKAQKVNRRVDTSTQSSAVTVHFHVCPSGGKHTVAWMEAKSADDAAYDHFGDRLNTFLAEYIAENWKDIVARGVAEPDMFDGLPPSAPIHRYAELRVAYPGEVDWEIHTDLLRCNALFNGSVRYDCVLVEDRTGGLPFFARIVTVFRCFPYPGSSFSLVLALVQPYTQRLENNSRKRKIDKDLRFYRVRSLPRRQSMLVPVENIVRGALLAEDRMGQPPIVLEDWAPDFSRVQDYLVVDLIDEDMFIRMQSLEYVGRRPGLFDDT